MGTRNTTIVILDKEIKVAQYGQWYGQPNGQGLTVLEFFKKNDLEDFKKRVGKLKTLEGESLERANRHLKSERIKGYKLKDVFPEYSRNEGANILNLIMNNKIWENRMRLEPDFRTDSDCIWGYIINLDTNRLLIENHTVPVFEFDLKDLPNEDDFLKQFKKEDNF